MQAERVAQVVVQDERADAHRRGGLGGDRERYPGRQDVREVVGGKEDRVAESFGPTRLLTPVRTVLGPADADPEPERPGH